MHTVFLTLIAILPLLAAAVPTAPNPNIIPLTKRAKATNDDGVANVDFLRRQLSRVISKVDRGVSAFEKNTGSPHPNALKKLKTKRAGTGSVSLTDEFDGSLWQGSVSVGTPASTFTVDFDTGSSDFFLPGTNCRVNCQGHTLYRTDASATARDLRKTYSLAFGDGSTVQGELFSDSVTVGGIAVTNQSVGSSTQYSAGLAISEFPPDGLMGMGFEQISVFGANPFFQTAIAQKAVTEGQFGVKLATTGSELFLGGVNTQLFTGSLTQVPVTEVGFWEVTLESANVNGVAAVSNIDTIIDTGTTLVVGDMASVEAFYAQVPGSMDASSTVGAGFFTFPCNSPPSISLTFSGKAFTISEATFNLGQVSAGSNQCVGGIVGEDGVNFWVLGDVFLQNVYTVFHVNSRQVGFATLA